MEAAASGNSTSSCGRSATDDLQSDENLRRISEAELRDTSFNGMRPGLSFPKRLEASSSPPPLLGRAFALQNKWRLPSEGETSSSFLGPDPQPALEKAVPPGETPTPFCSGSRDLATQLSSWKVSMPPILFGRLSLDDSLWTILFGWSAPARPLDFRSRSFSPGNREQRRTISHL